MVALTISSGVCFAMFFSFWRVCSGITDVERYANIGEMVPSGYDIHRASHG